MVGYDSDAWDSDIIYEPESYGEPSYYTDDFDELASDWVIHTPDVEDVRTKAVILGTQGIVKFFKCKHGDHWHFRAKGVTQP